MEREHIFIVMVINMKGNGKKEKSTEKEFIHIVIKVNMKGNFLREKKKEKENFIL